MAWDNCRMGKLTLTQSISKYCQIILKLERFHECEKVRGFLQGLHNQYKPRIKTQYLKMLEDAFKNAQIYNDNVDDKPPHVLAKLS